MIEKLNEALLAEDMGGFNKIISKNMKKSQKKRNDENNLVFFPYY